MKSWYDIYKDRMNEKYQKHIKRKYAGFIDQVNSELRDVKYPLVAEYGCGAANISRVLKNALDKNSSFVLIDTCPKMLSLAMVNMGDSDSLFLNRSILDENLCEFLRDVKRHPIDLIHSHGVLEHFSDEDINTIIENQKAVCRGPLIHYVPSAKYENPSRGDERLMTPGQWYEICKPDEILELNNGFDLVLKWRNND